MVRDSFIVYEVVFLILYINSKGKNFYQFFVIYNIRLMILKKQIISFTLIIILLTINSGCISTVDTSFILNSMSVIDYYGFPSIILNFSVTDMIFVNLIAPNNTIKFNDKLYANQNEVIIPLAPYQNNPQAGEYKIEVNDRNGKLIHNKTLLFGEINFTIFSLQGHWWKNNYQNSTYCLLGITLKVVNNGDLPIYPHHLALIIENRTISADILPTIVFPGCNKSINCSLYLENISEENKNCHIFVYDKNDNILTETTLQTIPTENISIYHFKWEYNKKEKEIDIPYPSFLYNYYNRKKRLDSDDYAAYIFDPYDEIYLTLITDILLSIAEDLDELSKINFIASFVQNLEYGEDDPLNSSYEYPLYPVESLYNQPCDCEDRSILAGNLLKIMGYNVSLLSLPKHMAVGVNIDQNLSEFDLFVDKYYYLETIEKNMVLGEVPKLYRNISDLTVIYDLLSRPILHHKWIKAERILVNDIIDFVKLKLIVENIGTISAEKVIIICAFYSLNDEEFNQEKIVLPSLKSKERIQTVFRINVPTDISAILKTKLYIDAALVEEKHSNMISS